MPPPTVSVVMPAYNVAPTLVRAIESIRSQAFTDWELIVVDDGSTDDTALIAASAADEDPRIRVQSIDHGGIVAALNVGLAQTRAPLIARMDADDEAMPERLQEQQAMLHCRPDLGLLGCLVEYGGDPSAALGYALHVDWINSLVTSEEIALNRFVESPLAHPSVMFRRDLVERYGGYRTGDFPEDYELWLRLMDAGVRMAKVPRVLLRWNDPPHRLSRTESRYSPEAFFRLKAEWIARQIKRMTPRPVWVWGAGRPTRKRAAHLEQHDIAIAGFIDIDPRKTNRTIGGRPVLPATELPPPTDAIVLGYVGSRGARDLIRTDLTHRGYAEGHDFLMCA